MPRGRKSCLASFSLKALKVPEDQTGDLVILTQNFTVKTLNMWLQRMSSVSDVEYGISKLSQLKIIKHKVSFSF